MEGIFCVSLFAFYDESFVGAKNCIIVLVILMDAAGCANSWQSMANEKNWLQQKKRNEKKIWEFSLGTFK